MPTSIRLGNSEERSALCPVVGIGASAGGLEALEQLFAHVPPEPGVAFVVVSHLAPHLPSLMPELLAKQTALPVSAAEDGARVEPDHVYIIPPNAALTLEHGALRLEARDDRTNLIDTFLRSLAEERGERAIGVILSGTGSDGSLGLKAIKEHGGVAMAQELASAKYNTMPRTAIDAGQVDWILPVEAMPAKVMEYVARIQSTSARPADGAHEPTRAREHDVLMNQLCALIHRRTGRDFSRYKRSTMERRVQRRIHVLQQRSLEDYVDLLKNTPAEVDQLFQDLLISVTQFFRDPELFEALARDVLPRILADRAPDDPVRVWVPGCATGEEAYSIAMILVEAPQTAARGAKIFATDIDDEALEVARAGRYPETIADRVSPERLERFFAPRPNGGWQVRKEIRDMCVFSTHSIISDPPFSRLDLISCRNVLIYLESDLQRTVFPLFHYGLRPGGFLLLGPSENVTAHPELFTVVDAKQRIFQRKEAKVSVRFPLGGLDLSRRIAEAPQGHEPAARDQSLTRTLERLILAVYAPPAVIVRGNGGIVFVSGQTRKFLELAPGAAGINVLEMASKELRPHLHVLLREATSKRQERIQRGVSLPVDGRIQPVDIVVRPLLELGADSDLYAVIFYEAGTSLSSEQAEAEGRTPAIGDAHAAALETELRSTRENLQTAVEELEVANEELKSTNEELQSSNEELQSANEELQTSKEELQSINEELHTVNAELSRKLQELDKANNDLQNLFASSRIATVFLNGDLTIKRFSPEASQLFRLIDSDVGRDITDIVPKFAGGDLVADVERVLQTQSASQREVQLLDADVWYQQRIQPYRTTDDVVVGVVITFVDITDLKSARDSARRLAAIVESSHDAILALDDRAAIVTWNNGAEVMFGHTAKEAAGRTIDFLAAPDESSPFASAFAAALRGERSPPIEAFLQRKDGSRVRVLASLSPITDTQGSRAAVSWIARDITEHERDRQALRESQERFHEVNAADRKKTEFLALLGHELRNPLAPIRNAIHYLRRALPTPTPAIQRAVGMVDRQAAHMARLIDDLLDVSRISSGKILLKKRREDLVAVVRTVVEDHRAEAARAGVSVQFTAREPLPVNGDAVRLSQCISNILGNAFKFTDPGGRISVVLERRGDTAVVRVSDNGVGMDPETLARAFEPFAQSDVHLARGRGGLGLGLSLVKALVELHGGTVEATSAGQGRGTEVSIRLPLVASAPPDTEVDAPELPGRPDDRRNVLVIEDNEDAAQSLGMLLGMWGHAAAIADSGAAGVEAALADPPDVVLCDLSLSGSMDGYEVCRALRAASSTAGALIIALTGHGLPSDTEKVKKAGFDLHLIKPVDPEALARIIHHSPLVHAPG
ncbi:chemotaxis protein CheB [Nannocystis punicea]|uniref:PAS domain S-box protein n=1 Tax=Nannocystis punicea TaxID=2995304 RepID=A0ABY7HJY0_9BACT|nr:chemotaxis protein CheB [Nannocystis poenicansa]WAS99244.1 PAS domain S-box protein [Nannocystis poenicansa]